LLLVLLAALWPVNGVAAESSDTGGPGCLLSLTYESFSGLVLVPVTIAGSPPMDFVLDSGASQSAITDPYLALALGLEADSTGLARGVGAGAIEVLITDVVRISSQGIEILRASLIVHDVGVQIAAMAGRDLHGLLGSELFKRYVVEIDPDRRHLVLHDPRDFVYQGSGTILPLEVISGRPVVEAEVVIRAGKRAVPVRLMVDTGSSRFLTLVTGSKRQLKPPRSTVAERTIGVTGAIAVELAPIDRIDLAGAVVTGFDVAWMESYRMPATRTIPKLNGVVGNGLLSRFRAFFDYRGGRLILEPLPPR
jgi:hypothetical protein